MAPADATVDISGPRSDLAGVLASLPDKQRQGLGLDCVALVHEAAFSAAEWAGKVDGRWVMMRFLVEFTVHMHETGIDPDEASDVTRHNWVGERGNGRRTYLIRRFGAALIDRVEKAVDADLRRLTGPGLRTGAELLPLLQSIVAVEAILADDDPRRWNIADAEDDGSPAALIELAMADPDVYPAEFEPVEIERPSVAVEALLSDLEPQLQRKYAGARHAIESDGPDAVSQAAHSIVELLDRLLRMLSDEEDVLAWVQHQAEAAALTFERDGERHPTKRAQFLFVFSELCGLAAAQTEDLRVKLATAAARVRRCAQELKHSDNGPVDRAAALSLLRAVESILCAVSVLRNQPEVPEEVSVRFAELRERLPRLDSPPAVLEVSA